MKALFLGIGNENRADDSIGPRVAEALLQDVALRRAGVAIVAHSGEGASLMDLWDGVLQVVVVDAMRSGAPCGTVRRFDACREPLTDSVFHYSSHLFGLAEAVEMARALNRLPRQLVIFGIEGTRYDFGAPPSPQVLKALPGVIAAVRKELVAAYA